jgi:hypothetical protein
MDSNKSLLSGAPTLVTKMLEYATNLIRVQKTDGKNDGNVQARLSKRAFVGVILFLNVREDSEKRYHRWIPDP